MENDVVLEKAQAILAEKERKETCVKAGICPICGSPLKDISETREEQVTTRFLWRKIVDKYRMIDYYTVCSQDSTHYKKQNSSEYEDDDYHD